MNPLTLHPVQSVLRRQRSTAIFASAVVLVAACGPAVDQSDLADGTLPPTSPESAPLETQSIAAPAVASDRAMRVTESPNGSPSTGRMIGTRRFDNTLLGVDLATGRFSALAGNAELAGLGATRDDATVVTRRDRAGFTGAVLTVDDCLEERDETVCVLFTDRDGNVNDDDFFALAAEFPGPAKTSFDGRYVAVNLSDRAAGLSVITIYTRDGEFVDSHAQSGPMSRAGAYDWLPDGRLVYSIEGSELLGDPRPTGFFITDPYDATPQRQITLPAFYQAGSIETIESSPDGSQLLVNLEPRVGPRRPVLIDLDTLTVTQLIDRDDGSLVAAKSVVWGPDGEWVYVVVSTFELLSGPALDNSAGDTIVFLGRSDALFAYRADGTTHPMPVSRSDLSDDVRSIPTDDPASPGGEVGAGNYDGNLIWMP